MLRTFAFFFNLQSWGWIRGSAVWSALFIHTLIWLLQFILVPSPLLPLMSSDDTGKRGKGIYSWAIVTIPREKKMTQAMYV
jgi:hypothetical protein